MVYVASLSFVAKKALGNKFKQVTPDSLINVLAIDPAESEAEVILLGPKDVDGPFGEKIKTAIANRHPDICVVYVYTNDKEAKLFPEAPNSKRLKQLKGPALKEAVDEFYGKELRDGKKTTVQSAAAMVADLGENPTPVSVIPEEPAQEEEVVSAPPEMDIPEPAEEPAPEPPAPDPNWQAAEDVIDSVRSVQDWNVLKRTIERDSILRELIMKNSEFSGIVNMLDVWDLRIRDIWMDPYKTPEEKLSAIKEFGANRQVLQAAYNSKLVDKFVSIMERIVSVCSTTVDQRIDQITKSLAVITSNKDSYIEYAINSDNGVGDQLFDRMVELQGIIGELCNMFAFLHKEGMENIVKRLNEKLPSSNEYINRVIDIDETLFTPGNSVNLATTIIEALSRGQIQLSMLEDKLVALMDHLFNVIKAQQSVIDYQSNVINILRANRIEDVVVRDSLLKECFHVVLGAENTGLTATVATYAGMLSRRDNTLVVDVTGHAHYGRYGYSTITLDEFLVERVQNPLQVVVGDPLADPERVYHLMEELKGRLSYYRHIIVVLDITHKDALDQIGREALSISYLTNCTNESLDAISEAYILGKSIPNVCHKLICIDSPVDTGTLLSRVGMDMALTRLIPLPHLAEMRKAAIVGQQPHTYNDVLRVFEEAFRV